MVLDSSLVNSQDYKVLIKGIVEQSTDRCSVFPVHLGVVAIEKGHLVSPSTTVAKYGKHVNVAWNLVRECMGI